MARYQIPIPKVPLKSAGLSVVRSTQSTRLASGDTHTAIHTNVKAGNLIVVTTSLWNPNGTTVTVSDNINGVYTQASSGVMTGFANEQLFIHYFANSGAGDITVTINPQGDPSGIDFVITEISGAATTNVLDSGTSGNGTGDNPSVTTGTFGQVNNIVFGIMTQHGTSVSLASGSGYSMTGENENNVNGQCFNSEYKIVASASAVAVDWTASLSGVAWVAVWAAFRAAVTIKTITGKASITNAQFAYPISDVSAASWTVAPLFSKVDEVNIDDVDFISSSLDPVNDECELQLTALTDPGSSSNHIIRFRYQKETDNATQIDLTVSLYQGGTLIAAQSFANIGYGWTTNSFTLAGAEADSITDYSNLRIKLKANEV